MKNGKRILLAAVMALTLLANSVPVFAADLQPAEPTTAPYTYLAQTGSPERAGPSDAIPQQRVHRHGNQERKSLLPGELHDV